MNKYLVTFYFIIVGFQLQAQEILLLEEALKIALENNYDIKIAKNNLKIDATNNNLANAGLLPVINANFVDNNSEFNTSQTQADGRERTLDGAINRNISYGVSLDWTIFDGFTMFARREQLKTLEIQGKSELQAAILNRISEVYVTYYDIVQQQQVLQSIENALLISNERYKLAQNRYSIGKASKLEVLNAQVDLNADKSFLLQQMQILKNTKTRLNELLARDLKTNFEVNNQVITDATLNFENLKELALKQNPTLQAQILNKKIADLNLKQIKGNRYPNIRLTSGYNFTQSEATLGFITQSSGQGFVYGVSATVPVFNGFLQNKREKAAKYEVENASFILEQQKLSLESQLAAFYQNYQTNLELVSLEETNLQIAKQNLDITIEKFKIGTITPIEVRTAQQNYINTTVRKANALYAAKLAEINLKELAGNLNLN